MVKEKFKKTICLLLLLQIFCDASAQKKYQPELWYNEPANAVAKDNKDGWSVNPEWLKALPVGNGYLGAMVFGDVNHERIQLNEKSLWSGSPADNDNSDAAKYLPEIRKLLFEGKYKEATKLTAETQICKGAGTGNGNGAKATFGCYQTLGDLRFDFHKNSTYKNYYRQLDLVTGIALARFQQNGITYTREVFASYPDKAIIIHLTANKPNAISFALSLDRPERFTTVAENNRLVMSGTLDNGIGGNGMKYKTYAVPVLTGGSMKTINNTLEISNATAITIIITAATNYRLHYPDYINNNFETALEGVTKKAVAKKYAVLKQNHVRDFSPHMLRNTLQINNGINYNIPANRLLERNITTKNEPALYALYYAYGRYLLLSSSRKGSLPANLQGIWANQIQTPWNGDYHTDINVQMNYWPAEVANLSECHLQLTDFIQSLVQPGKHTAQIQHNTGGWSIHPVTNVWGYTAPGEEASWGLHVGATAWICQHLFTHYAFTKDENYLRRVWPVLKEACRFYFDWLVTDAATGKLVSGPAASPENSFIASDGSEAQISMGPSHDQEVIYDLFKNTSDAATILQLTTEKSFTDTLQQKLQNLARPAIAKDGRLMEWAEEFKEVDPHHRHVSHLFALYPGNEISFYKTPEYASAAKQSLITRGDGGTGWSLAWKIAFWARLHEGDSALMILNNLLHPPLHDAASYNDGGGSYYNLFDACPPFQIDGNFGATAAIAEMLLQSHEGFIELLPALPAKWKDGEVNGLVARGDFLIYIQWKNHQLTNAKLLSKKGGICIVKYRDKKISLSTKQGQYYSLAQLINK